MMVCICTCVCICMLMCSQGSARDMCSQGRTSLVTPHDSPEATCSYGSMCVHMVCWYGATFMPRDRGRKCMCLTPPPCVPCTPVHPMHLVHPVYPCVPLCTLCTLASCHHVHPYAPCVPCVPCVPLCTPVHPVYPCAPCRPVYPVYPVALHPALLFYCKVVSACSVLF